MLTSGDIQYEPPSHKTFALTKYVVSMMSGDAAFYTEIMDSVLEELRERHDQRVPVAEIARMFVGFRNEALRQRAENAILGPLGLKSESFLQQQQFMDAQLVDKLATELLNFDVPGIDVIIAGVDVRSQIYVMVDGDLSCNNAIGFASVGSGSRHAESQFMLARHSWTSPLAETLFLTYAAKKRSEVAPGVGRDTDMIMIHPDETGITEINPEIITRLEAVYDDLRLKEEANFEAASRKVVSYVEEITASAGAASQEEAPARQPSSVDQKASPARRKGRSDDKAQEG